MAVNIQIQIKNLPQIRAAFKKAPALMTKNLNIAIRKTIFFIEKESQERVNVKTGRLRASRYTKFSPFKGEFGYNANYAEAVHEGSKAHTILPKTKKALFWDGANHPVRMVRHPGYKGNPFLQEAVDASQPQVDKFFGEAVEDTLNTIAKEAS